jgi:hypothetical protein
LLFFLKLKQVIMNKLNFVIAFMLMMFFSITTNAQNKYIIKANEFGIRGGINLASVTSTSSSSNFETDNVTGLDAALSLGIGINNLFSIQPELHFMQKGWELTLAGITTANKVNYLELPILAKVAIGVDALKFYGVAGPSLGYAMGGTVSITALGSTTKNDYTFSNDEARIDIGAVLGVGAELKAGPGALVLDARYNYDLNDDGNSNSLTNRGIGLTAGYLIRF